MRKRRHNDKALQQALQLLGEARAIGELADAPGSPNLTEIIDRSLALFEAVAKLRAEHPGGLISAEEVKALVRAPGDPVH